MKNENNRILQNDQSVTYKKKIIGIWTENAKRYN